MADMAVDPVCKMLVDPEKAPATSDHNGMTYYFCAVGCKRAFDEDPEKYLSNAAPAEMPHAPAAPASAGPVAAAKRPWWRFWKS